MIHCLFLISRQGKTRLTKWFSQSFTNKEKTRYLKEVMRATIRLAHTKYLNTA